MCSATPSSQKTFSAVVSNITAGCSEDCVVPNTLLNIAQTLRSSAFQVAKLPMLANIGIIVKTLKAYTQLQPRASRFRTRIAHQKRRLDMRNAQFDPYGSGMNLNTTCTTCVKGAVATINADFPGVTDCLFPNLRDVYSTHDQNNSTSPASSMSNPSANSTQSDTSPSDLTKSVSFSRVAPSFYQASTQGTNNPSPQLTTWGTRSSSTSFAVQWTSGAVWVVSLVAVL
ncbi:hypothetical protein L208DRAFT_1382006 [Tricholoma matsutake]|nr:hypothetical protein L208DRAFT_1382006 [Tricholoma matsutake 945]